MINLTNNDYRKIQAWLKANAIKDSDLEYADDFKDEDVFTIVQNSQNKKVLIKDFIEFLDKDFSRKSNTIRHFDLYPIATANGLSLLLEGEYDDSVQGSHLLGPHNIILPYATESKAGVMSPEDKEAIIENKNTIETLGLITAQGFQGVDESIARVRQETNASIADTNNAIAKLNDDIAVEILKLQGQNDDNALAIESKQDILVSGENIKTINGQSLVGSGNITISSGGSSVMSLSGKLNLADKTAVQNAQKALANTNEIAYYLITDNEGKIPSNVPCYRVTEDVATALGCSSPHTITQSALSLLNISLNGFGVNVGDLIALTRVKVKVSDLASAIGKDLSILGNTEIEIYQYKILSTNDAKPYGYNGVAEGVAGLMSPWDKEQVNKALLMPAFNVWDNNMNECFESGIYPWCLTGRPEGSANGTHYTCVVEKSTTADTSGFYTIVQTCYGREGVDEGKIFKRIIFRKEDGTTNWGVGWKRIDEGALDSLGAFIEENLATKDEVDTAIANAITNTLNTPV